MAAIDILLPLLKQPKSVADLVQMTGYKRQTIWCAMAELKRWGRVEVEMRPGPRTVAGATRAIYRLKP